MLQAVLAVETRFATLTSIVHVEEFSLAAAFTGIHASGVIVNCTQVQLCCVSYLVPVFQPCDFTLAGYTLQEHLPAGFFHGYVLSCKKKESRKIHR